MSNQEDNTQTPLEIKLQNLRDTPERDVLTAASQRAAFIEKAKSIKTLRHNRSPVSSAFFFRHIEWKHLLKRKEGRKMSFITTLLIVSGLVFGGTGVTVAAAQSAMPDDLLYPVKLASEGIAVAISPNSDAAVNAHLKNSQRRANELYTILNEEGVLNDDTSEQFLDEIDNAIEETGGMKHENMMAALIRIEAHMQSVLLKMQENDLPETARQNIQNLILKVQARIMALENGERNPSQFKEKVQNGELEHEVEMEMERIKNNNKDKNKNHNQNKKNEEDLPEDALQPPYQFEDFLPENTNNGNGNKGNKGNNK